jgi:uncharacterized protein YqeY
MSESLREEIQRDMIAAMKAKEKEKTGVLRMLFSRLKDAAIDSREELDRDAETRILMTYAKQREEGLVEARKANREDLILSEQFELDLVRGYLPEPLGDAELEALVVAVIAEEGAASMKDMGRVMKATTARAAGRADGTRISALVKQKLAG